MPGIVWSRRSTVNPLSRIPSTCPLSSAQRIRVILILSIVSGEYDKNIHYVVSECIDKPLMKIHTKPVKKRSSLTCFARRIPARATWEKLTLPERQLVALRKIIHQVNQLPGNGCRGLLSGPTSNHKMMAAQVAARELKRPLYQINLIHCQQIHWANGKEY